MASGLLLLALGPAGSGLLVRLPEPAPADTETVLCPAGLKGLRGALLARSDRSYFDRLIGAVAAISDTDVAPGIEHLRNSPLSNAQDFSDLGLRSALGEILKGDSKVIVHDLMSVCDLSGY